MEHPCGFCGGAAHGATGCEYGQNVIACWRCTKEAWEWVRSQTNGNVRRKRRDGTYTVNTKLSFYEAAGKSYEEESHGGAREQVNPAGCDPAFDRRDTGASPHQQP